ncbi:MAG: hypothetical protein M0Z50_11830 [Planctomycetia bacterium]|nr:hypothetical protein [Planctomycetia bacterium]
MRASSDWRAVLFQAAAVLALAMLAMTGICSAAATTTVASQPLLTIPSGAAQASSKAYLEKVFNHRYPRPTAWALLDFSRYLMRKYGSKSAKGVSPAIRYVALNLAWRLGAKSGDFPLAYEPIHAIASSYRVDRYRLHLEASRLLLAHLGNLTVISDLGDATRRWSSMAADTGDFTVAHSLLLLAGRCYLRCHNLGGLEKARRLAQRLTALEPLYKQHAKDKKKLKISPDDSATLVRMALYDLLVSRKQTARLTGEALAKKSGSAALAEILKLAAKNPQDAQQLIRLGNLWWNLSKTHKLLAYAPLVQQRAAKIYYQAIPHVDRAFSAMIGRGDYHTAVLFIGEAKKAAKRTRAQKLLAIARRWNLILRQARVLHHQYTAALKTIAKKANDPTVNQAIGEYLCFLGGRWKAGLNYLKLAGLPGLRTTAQADLRNPQTPAAQITLGNMWWRLASSYRGILRKNIELRAAKWYALALSKLPAGQYRRLRRRVEMLRGRP